MKITQAIIPAAGLGTRFLPYTKAVAKELLPLLEKPAIHTIIEEGISSGIDHFSIITNDEKEALKTYFSPHTHLDNLLAHTKKEQLLEPLNAIIAQANFSYIPQPEPLGLGHAVLLAEKNITDNYCTIFLPDEIMTSAIPAMKQLIALAHTHNASIIAVQEVPENMVSSYGIVGIKHALNDTLFEISHVVEKPSPSDAPSCLAIIGRYVLSRDIFTFLKTTHPGAGNEIQLTDGIAQLIQSQRVLACKVDAIRHDIGTPLGWLQANIYAGLTHPLYGEPIRHYMTNLLSNSHIK